MHDGLGDPIHGELHTADAHLGVQIPIYLAGSVTPFVMGANDWLEIHSIELISAAGGDIYIAVDTAVTTPGTPTPGTTVVRGTVAATSGIVMSIMHFTGQSQANGSQGLPYLPWLVAPAGVVDVVIRGTVRHNTKVGRPTWREHYQTTGNQNNISPQ